MKKYDVGIIGATGTVGQKYIALLENHPWFNVKILAASEKSAGKYFEEAVKNRWTMDIPIPEKLKKTKVLDAQKDIKKIVSCVNFVFCAVNMPKDKTKILEEAYAKAECPVISNNSAHRNTPDIPMIIPEINAEHMKIIPIQKKRLQTQKGFIATKSNCSIQCYVPALHPLKDLKIKNVLVCTYQAISGAGKNFDSWPEMKNNIIPFIAGEEEKSEQEPLKIWGTLQNEKIISSQTPKITSQCLRVPVSTGHTAAVFASFEKKPPCQAIIEKWQNFKPCKESVGLPSSPKKFLHYYFQDDRPQIITEKNIENGMGISIGRLRPDTQYDIKFVCMSHNTIRGAAGGAILLAEMLCAENYI